MAAINVSQLLVEMLKAAEVEFAERWPDVRGYAESGFTKMLNVIASIDAHQTIGMFQKEKVRLFLEMQKNTTRCMLFTVEGLSAITVEAAINAALHAVKDTVNMAVGFSLIQQSVNAELHSDSWSSKRLDRRNNEESF